MAHPYGLANASALYQEALHDLYADQIGDIHPLAELVLPSADQFAPAINMVQIRQLDDDSLLPILEADLGAESEGSTKTVTETITDLIANSPSLSKCFPRKIFMICADSVARDGETDAQRVA